MQPARPLTQIRPGAASIQLNASNDGKAPTLSPKQQAKRKTKGGHSKNKGSLAIASVALFDDLDLDGDRVGGGRGSVIVPQDFKFSSTGTPLSNQRGIGAPPGIFNAKRLSGTSKKSALFAQSMLKPLTINSK